jgi:hypothetical protein
VAFLIYFDLGLSNPANIQARIEDGILHAVIFAKNDIYAIEPASHYSFDGHAMSSRHTHVIHRMSDLKIPAGHKSCGINDEDPNFNSHQHMDSSEGENHSLLNKFFQLYANTTEERSQSRRTGYNNDITKTTCEVSFYADHRYFASQGGFSTSTTANNIISYAAGINQIYRVSSEKIIINFWVMQQLMIFFMINSFRISGAVLAKEFALGFAASEYSPRQLVHPLLPARQARQYFWTKCPQ